MSKVKSLPRFKVGDTADLLPDPNSFLPGEEIDPNVILTQEKVTARFDVEKLGWVYRMENVQGLVEERFMRHPPKEGEEGHTASVYVTGMGMSATHEEIREGLAEARFHVGQFIRLPHEDVVDEATDLVHPAYAIITGISFWAQDLAYDVAMMAPDGTFVDDASPAYDDEIELIPDEEMMAIIARLTKPKPKLTLAHSA